ncbi:F-box protein SKIP23-like [Rutidosis leptorrhynchoides]|uniref:F-box protein SKIP23-like n=1 Tax=Rutidosis leptorrhynchoides TaxID=125765 RepID=UPI003A9A5C8E
MRLKKKAIFDLMDWSVMIPEILDIIAKKHNLFYEDYICFAGVCKSWRSAAARAAHNGLPSHFPSLLLADKTEDYVTKKYCLDDHIELFCLSNKCIRTIRLPEGSGKLCMFSGGLLLTIGDDFGLKLINPFSHEIINLPKISNFPEFGSSLTCDNGIRKVVVVKSSLVVMLWGASGNLVVCRYVDEKCRDIVIDEKKMFLDIMIYSICQDHRIKACDDYEGNNLTSFVTVSKLPKRVFGGQLNELNRKVYIVGLEDDNGLLVVIREVVYDVKGDLCGRLIYKTARFRVFKYDLDSKEWSEVKNLGTKALFVGYGQSFLMEEDSRWVVKENCIYFTEDFCNLNNGSLKGRDMGVYHMSSRTIEYRFPEESDSHFALPIWIQPVLSRS